MIERSFTIQIEPNAEEIAMEFCKLDSDEMAEFFNFIYEFSKEWDNAFCMQMQYLSESKKLKPEGIKVMNTIGEYSNG